jgi:hypothetical protein
LEIASTSGLIREHRLELGRGHLGDWLGLAADHDRSPSVRAI